MAKSFSPLMTARWFGAEFLGTLVLAAVAITASQAQLGSVDNYTSLYVPFAVGGVIMLMVYLVGSISGAHFNPAVSVAQFAFRKISLDQFITHVVAQLAGAWVGVKLAFEFTGVQVHAPILAGRPQSLAEFTGALIAVFTIMMVVQGRVKQEMAGFVIGTAFFIALTLAMVTGAGIFNPALALTFGATTSAYLLMPFLGGLCGAAIAVLLDTEK